MSPLNAMEILGAAQVNARTGTVNTPEVKAALRRLKPLCPERRPLDAFWDAAASPHEIGRAQSPTAAFNRIAGQLGLPRWVEDA
jgi:hypothetical protein